MKNKAGNIVLSFVTGACTVIGLRMAFDKNKKMDKMGAYYSVLNNWMYLKENNGSVAQRLKEKSIKSIAIYGMGDLGKHLKKDLEGSDVVVQYAIDRSFWAVSDIDIYEPDSKLPKVDAIIVTAVFDYESIYKKLKGQTDASIVSIADLVGEGWN